MIPLAAWTHAVSDIPAGGLSHERVASVEERAAIATMLGLISLAALKVTYRIARLAGGGCRLHGRLVSDLEQACIVTLDTVPEHMDETFDTEFWPDIQPGKGEQDAPVLDGRDVEPLDGGGIAAGRIIFETFAAALDPYPRTLGAEFSWQQTAGAAPEKTNPFAALAKLKGKP